MPSIRSSFTSHGQNLKIPNIYFCDIITAVRLLSAGVLAKATLVKYLNNKTNVRVYNYKVMLVMNINRIINSLQLLKIDRITVQYRF